MSSRKLVNYLANLELPDTFNPYADRCVIHDRHNAPALRRSILQKMLESARSHGVDALWIGRDLGHRGGRRTGMALTDDVRFFEHAARWDIQVRRPTKGALVRERTADMVWGMLSQIDEPVFMWNVFPLHPHEPGKPFSNRQHTALERDLGEDILVMLIELLQPARLIAIGNNAGASATRVFHPDGIRKVRHPSYGGQSDFVASIEKLYRLRRRRKTTTRTSVPLR